jgi:RNA recognition motif-containing protein
MAFVGFRSPDDAARALKYFHRSFMDTNRLMVEEARRVNEGSTAVERPWSKYSKGALFTSCILLDSPMNVSRRFLLSRLRLST